MKRKFNSTFFKTSPEKKESDLDLNQLLPDPAGFGEISSSTIPLKKVRSFAPSPVPSDFFHENFPQELLPDPLAFNTESSNLEIKREGVIVRHGLGLIKSHKNKLVSNKNDDPFSTPKKTITIKSYTV